MSVTVNQINSPIRGENTCMNCAKRCHSLLGELSFEELRILDRNKYTVTYRANETICKEGTKSLGLICLNKGKVKITRSGMSGSEQILTLKKPVDFVGFRALMNGNTYLSSAIAIDDVSICIIDRQDFFEVIAGNDQLAFRIIRFLAHQLNEMDNRLFNLTQKHIRARLADALLMIHDIYGTNTKTGILNVSLKRADLAALANMTIANAIRLLSSFSKENLIEVNRRDIKIMDLKGLRDLSVFGF